MQTDATLLDVACFVRLLTLLHVVAQSLKPVKLFSQQLPTFLLFRDRRSVEQQDAVGAYIWAWLFLAYVKFVMCMRDMWVVQWYCVFEG